MLRGTCAPSRRAAGLSRGAEAGLPKPKVDRASRVTDGLLAPPGEGLSGANPIVTVAPANRPESTTPRGMELQKRQKAQFLWTIKSGGVGETQANPKARSSPFSIPLILAPPGEGLRGANPRNTVGVGSRLPKRSAAGGLQGPPLLWDSLH